MGTIVTRTLFTLAVLAAGVAAKPSGRIVEKPLHFETLDSNDVPVVDPPKRTAGYFKLNRTHDARMFYFFFESRSDPRNDPVVLWMTGGPGCSSELAIFYENGPFSIKPDLSLSETPYGWDVGHNVIFVDQPINTGFSYSDDDRDRVFDEVGVAEDMLDFLQEFFEVHPEFASNEFFVTGESYAGHYVPAVSHRLWKAAKEGEGKSINIKGLAIGNGLTDPSIQYGAYADFAYQNRLIDKAEHDSIQFYYPLCRFTSDLCSTYTWSWLCSLSANICSLTIFARILESNPQINVYDITKKCEGQLCYDFSLMERFVKQPSVRRQLGVNVTWQACSPAVYSDMMGDMMRRYDVMLPEMLADGVRVLIYAGELDLICNWLGNRRWVDALAWSQQMSWLRTPEEDWEVDGVAAGSVVELQPLTFLKVFKAGHMVPMDQPKAALEMIHRFTRGKSLVSQQNGENDQRQAGASGSASSVPGQLLDATLQQQRKFKRSDQMKRKTYVAA